MSVHFVLLTGMSLKKAYAEGNALGKGPLVFHMPQSMINTIRARAALGEPAFAALELAMFRTAALFVMDRQRAQIITHVVKVSSMHACMHACVWLCTWM